MFGKNLAFAGIVCLLLSGCYSSRGADVVTKPAPRERIVFASNRDESHVEIYVMEADGSGVERLTFNAVQDGSPLLSPNGSKLTFRRELNPSSVFVMNVDGSSQIGLAPGDRGEWSPDGSKIALVADSLCVMNSDATGRRCFGVGASFASWKPDGSVIAYVSTGLGGQSQNDIYTIHPDGTGALRVTTDGVEKQSLAWSPDGSKLMYTAPQGVFIINADGGGLSSPCQGRDARWSPDGQRVVFVTDIYDGNEEIYTVRLDGTDPRNLTRNPASDTEPDWGPKK